jgi:hypothetical protein
MPIVHTGGRYRDNALSKPRGQANINAAQPRAIDQILEFVDKHISAIRVRADYWCFLRKWGPIVLPDCPSFFLFGWAKVRILSFHVWNQHRKRVRRGIPRFGLKGKPILRFAFCISLTAS